MKQRVELGCDTGEAATDAGRARESALLAHVSAVSIACGGHAGDDASMCAMAAAAKDAGCVIGAHPSYPDRAHFGRRPVAIETGDLLASIGAQIGALAEACAETGAAVSFVKPHGALYHAVSGDEDLAGELGELVARTLPGAALVGPIGSPALGVWSEMGVRAIAEGFADRAYEADGRLRARGMPGAVITNADEAAAQAVRLAPSCGMLCVHGDSLGAVGIAEAVRRGLDAHGIGVGGVIGSRGEG
jgi:UPF0271 protein